MSITAEKLSKMGTHGSTFRQIVRDQLSAIDSELQRHTKQWGRNVVTYELPSVFTNTGLSRKQTQLIIYSQIIRSLKDRGFEVRIAINADHTVLFVVWVTEVDPAQIRAMTATIKKAAIDPKDIDAFRNSAE